MITPVKTMTINQIVERKDDLLVSDADIRELAKNERAKAIDEFAEAIRNDSNYIFDNNFGYVIPINDIDEIAEELRCKG